MKDMISFGKYLLSKEREKIKKDWIADKEAFTNPPSYEDVFREVSHADFHNWKNKQ